MNRIQHSLSALDKLSSTYDKIRILDFDNIFNQELSNIVVAMKEQRKLISQQNLLEEIELLKNSVGLYHSLNRCLKNVNLSDIAKRNACYRNNNNNNNKNNNNANKITITILIIIMKIIITIIIIIIIIIIKIIIIITTKQQQP
jgi:uncharacterized protein YqhQ